MSNTDRPVKKIEKGVQNRFNRKKGSTQGSSERKERDLMVEKGRRAELYMAQQFDDDKARTSTATTDTEGIQPSLSTLKLSIRR